MVLVLPPACSCSRQNFTSGNSWHNFGIDDRSFTTEFLVLNCEQEHYIRPMPTKSVGVRSEQLPRTKSFLPATAPSPQNKESRYLHQKMRTFFKQIDSQAFSSSIITTLRYKLRTIPFLAGAEAWSPGRCTCRYTTGMNGRA